MNSVRRNVEFGEASVVVKDVCRSLIQAKRQRLVEEKGNTDVDIISVALESGGFTDEDLVNQMMTFLVAGHETTASAFTWAIYLLCKNSDMQKRLREEVQANLPNPLDPNSTISSTQLDSLPYLSAVCNEVFRLYPPVALTVRSAVRDTTIAGHVIPKGTSIVIPPWAVNTSTALWGSDSATFNPDRWLGPGRTGSGGATSNYAFLTFLHGPRSCIGQAFAKAEFACMLAAWVSTFVTELADKHFAPKLGGGITAKPKGGVHVVVRRWDDGQGT